ncbi:MAG: KEOPS complex subunit Pcc1 [Candidatus Micrarchaeia archaeon]
MKENIKGMKEERKHAYNYTATISAPAKVKEYQAAFEKSYKYKRSSVLMKFAGGKKEVVFKVEAKDPTALRATLNAILRDIQVIESVAKASGKK